MVIPEVHTKGSETEQKLILTTNQEKVIRDKYLRDDKSPEIWLRRIARNIALADILHIPKIKKEQIYKDVSHVIEERAIGDGTSVKVILIHKGLADYKSRFNNYKQYIANLYSIAENDPAARKIIDEYENKFYNLMANWDFLPNSPTLMNAGRDLQQLSGCYVLPVGDSIEEIFEAIRGTALVHKSGGGTGFSFGRLRPDGDRVITTSGVASGPLSFIKIFDVATAQLKQGGTRRGANMGILPYWHPDIFNFIKSKTQPGELENFNISIAIDEKFMQAVEKDETVDLVSPRTKTVVRKVKAKEIFELMVETAHATGDPGYVMIDRINSSNSNPTPALGEVESTNPCGEQPLLPYEACNLGSINLANFVIDKDNKPTIDYKRMEKMLVLIVRFLDNVIDVNNYPLAEIEVMAKGNRRIGLGVMGWAEMLVKLGIPYDSEEAIQKAEEVMEFVNKIALKVSRELTEERGVFPNFKDSIYDENGKFFRTNVKPRNAARTTIAPTGTIAIAAGLQGSGIEPFFSIAYVRYNAAGIDALKEGKTPADKDIFYEYNNEFADVAKKYRYFGLEEKQLWKRIAENHGSVRGIQEVPEKLQRIFASSHDVSPKYHIKHQVAFQKYTDNAVSKTINLPNSATVEDVRKAYWFAYKEGCKGLTVYRDGCKAVQILNIAKEETVKVEKHPRLKEKLSSSYSVNTGEGTIHITVTHDERGSPTEVFESILPLGTSKATSAALDGIRISRYLEQIPEPDLIELVKDYGTAKSDKPIGLGISRVDSLPHALSVVLRYHLLKWGILKQDESGILTQAKFKSKKGTSNGKFFDENEGVELVCPECGSRNVRMQGSCKEPTCQDCGYSKCS